MTVNPSTVRVDMICENTTTISNGAEKVHQAILLADKSKNDGMFYDADPSGGLGIQFKMNRESLFKAGKKYYVCLLYTSPSPRDGLLSRMPSSA